jgi:hypothetical protein
MVNGVDISDPTYYFSKEEWSKLDGESRKRIMDNPYRMSKKKARTGSNVSSIVTASEEEQNRLVASIINGVMNASAQNVGPPESVQVPPPRHGSRVSAIKFQSTQARTDASANDNRSQISGISYDHLDNRL